MLLLFKREIIMRCSNLYLLLSNPSLDPDMNTLNFKALLLVMYSSLLQLQLREKKVIYVLD